MDSELLVKALFSACVWIGLLAGLFIACRMLVWWYWGIDKIVQHQASIDESLKQLVAMKRHELRNLPGRKVA